MGTELGTNVLVYVRPVGATGAFTIIAGQRDSQMTRTRRSVDSTDKTTKGWATSSPGLKEASITCSGQCVWPDADGLGVVDEAWDDETATGGLVEVYCQLNAAGKGYYGTAAVASADISGPTEENTTYSLTLNPNGAMTSVEAMAIDTAAGTATIPAP
jgi:TP901-1 family phage major tail protein